MLIESVTYTNANDQEKTVELLFHLSKATLMANLDLQDRFEKLGVVFEGERREMSPPEIREILELIKEMIRLSYGVRTADGSDFQRSPAILAAFEGTLVYDEFLFSLFSPDPNRAVNFLVGIMPKELRDEAASKAAESASPEVRAQIEQLVPGTESTPMAEIPEDPRPAYIRENRNPNRAELMNMSQEELKQAFALRT